MDFLGTEPTHYEFYADAKLADSLNGHYIHTAC
jgi:hypothetical protein